MLRVGLTGGIASGKSTVAEFLRERDVPVLGLDVLGHEFLEPDQAAYDEVVGEFGEGILARRSGREAERHIDRAKLGELVFGDPAKRVRLERILHPRILEAAEGWFAALGNNDAPAFAVIEAALIIEAGYNKRLDKVVLCWCRPEQQTQRLLERGLNPLQTEQRIAAQWPFEKKRAFADEVVDCSGALDRTRAQVEAIMARFGGAKP